MKVFEAGMRAEDMRRYDNSVRRIFARISGDEDISLRAPLARLLTSCNLFSANLTNGVLPNTPLMQARRERVSNALSRTPPGAILHIDMGDMEFDDAMARRIRSHTPIVFATNNTSGSGGVENAPLGLIDLDGALRKAAPLGLLRQAWRPLAERKITVSQLTGILNNSQRRIPVPKAYKPSRRLSHPEYAETLGDSQMVVCSCGAAPDTYRFWETLYAGAVPIVWGEEIGGVGSGYFWKSYGDILPMINITDVSQLEISSLQRRLTDVLQKQWDLSPLLARFWIDKAKRLEEQLKRTNV
jgi:hypothetical protein